MSFKDQKVLVTGAGKGIGKGICEAMTKAGAEVFALSRTQTDLDLLKQQHPSIVTICADVSDVATTIEKLSILPPDITLLVNNAGFTAVESFLDVTEQSYDRIMNVNLKSMMFISQHVAKLLVAHGKGGKIVNVSSQASMVALPQHAVYCASKGGVDQLTRCMALELGPYNIRVNALNPTVVLTDMGRKAWSDPAKAQPMINQIPLGKFAEVDDIVNAVMFLLSERSNMIHGTTLPIDGGFLATRTMK